MIQKIPMMLVMFRALAAPGVLLLGWFGLGDALALLILLATLSDIFDGIIARRLGVSTVMLRRADSIVDMIFWLSAMVALYFLRPEAICANILILAFAIGAEIVQQGISLLRFKRMTATHARSAKFMGLCLLIGFMMIALGANSAIAFWIVGIGTAVATIDGWAIVLVMPRWEADVPSVFAAWGMRKGKPIERHWIG